MDQSGIAHLYLAARSRLLNVLAGTAWQGGRFESLGMIKEERGSHSTGSRKGRGRKDPGGTLLGGLVSGGFLFKSCSLDSHGAAPGPSLHLTLTGSYSALIVGLLCGETGR